MNIDKKQVRSDRWLKLMMRTGVPIGIVSVVCLWLGQWLASPALGSVFLVTMPIALVIGFSYNIRYVILAVRARRQAVVKSSEHE
ncbi:hypothetical protein Q4488_18175 [Amphritea sp. 1_MG-2023]|uniref:hypothetical protein n=1 Tax=Amphritea sp. 1_MG-2023 TaxID=3062670 RepID=UPI0026E14762|nr:hypothetical protein [Amphritea sp. 1_MG-2023]MDO6565305.1 hypothetical protein [Amphritea sp. 1_MG-2023]